MKYKEWLVEWLDNYIMPTAKDKTYVDRSELIVFYVERESGGAYTTMKYAVKNGKDIINISNIF